MLFNFQMRYCFEYIRAIICQHLSLVLTYLQTMLWATQICVRLCLSCLQVLQMPLLARSAHYVPHSLPEDGVLKHELSCDME